MNTPTLCVVQVVIAWCKWRTLNCNKQYEEILKKDIQPKYVLFICCKETIGVDNGFIKIECLLSLV